MRKSVASTVLFCALSVPSLILRAEETSPLQKLDPPPPISTQDYGTLDESFTYISATDFRPFDSATGYTTATNTAMVSRTGGGTQWFAHTIDLPSGALLVDVTAFVNDTNATSDVGMYLTITHRDVDTGLTPVLAYYPPIALSSGNPGATAIVKTWNNRIDKRFNVDADPAIEEVTWGILIALNAPDNTLGFQGVRLRWKRQVSPAPATARFDDVPTSHPFFQYIEALASAGITGGCVASPPQYCPDAPVTRGQMAVFLSRALGLHWTP